MDPQTSNQEVSAQAVFSEIEATFGMVPNFFTAQADDPQWLTLNWQRWKHIMGETRALDRKTKELLAIAVSLVNGCHYCTLAHENMARATGASDQELLELKQVVELFNSFNSIAESLKVPCDI